jgi:hypothetical protein
VKKTAIKKVPAKEVAVGETILLVNPARNSSRRNYSSAGSSAIDQAQSLANPAPVEKKPGDTCVCWHH